jgi:hypothetical protein
VAQKSSGRLVARIVAWTAGAVVVAAAVVFVAWLAMIYNALSPDPEPVKSPAEIAALEEELRSRGSLEDALVRYEAALQATANDISALAPGATWRWNREVSSMPCGGDFKQTRGMQYWTRNLVSSAPIPHHLREQAMELLRERASGLGVNHVNGVEVAGGFGGGVTLGQGEVAVLSGTTACHLSRGDL